MSSPHSLAVEIVKLMKEHANFTFGRGESDNNPEVETSLDVDGLSVYGGITAVVEFLFVVGYAVGDGAGDDPVRFTQLMELAENARVHPDGASIELVLPAFLAPGTQG